MTLKLITGPVDEPIPLAKAREHLRVETNAEDGLIASLIVAARMHVEAMTGRSLMTTEWELRADSFPCAGEAQTLPRAPLDTLDAVTYIDDAGAEQTVTSTVYQLIQPVGPTANLASVVLAYSQTWPTARGEADAVRYQFTAGYADEDAVPEPIKSAMLLIVGDLYENRQAQVAGAMAQLTPNATVAALLNPFRTLYL